MTREEIITLTQGYIDSYRRDIRIDEALKKFNIYIDIINNPLNRAVEKALSGQFKDSTFLSAVCAFAEDGTVQLINDHGNLANYDSIEEIVDYYLKDRYIKVKDVFDDFLKEVD